jgi:hypothetical protein
VAAWATCVKQPVCLSLLCSLVMAVGVYLVNVIYVVAVAAV